MLSNDCCIAVFLRLDQMVTSMVGFFSCNVVIFMFQDKYFIKWDSYVGLSVKEQTGNLDTIAVVIWLLHFTQQH
jgi:H+/gluconate symporter-like permease